jgi:membrane-associated phospholipid phosphatase
LLVEDQSRMARVIARGPREQSYAVDLAADRMNVIALRIGAAVWAAAGLLASLIGFSRIYLGVHYPSDVVAGYAAALVWVMSVALADRLLRGREREVAK